MNKTKKKLGTDSHDFNWVKAIEECSAKSEFAVLQSYIQKNVEDRNKTLVEDENCSLEFKVVSNEEFIVTRTHMGFTPISRTVELRVNPSVCAFPVVVVF